MLELLGVTVKQEGVDSMSLEENTNKFKNICDYKSVCEKDWRQSGDYSKKIEVFGNEFTQTNGDVCYGGCTGTIVENERDYRCVMCQASLPINNSIEESNNQSPETLVMNSELNND